MVVGVALGIQRLVRRHWLVGPQEELAHGVGTVLTGGRGDLKGRSHLRKGMGEAQMQNPRKLAVPVLQPSNLPLGDEPLAVLLPAGRQARSAYCGGKGHSKGFLQEQPHIVAEILDDLPARVTTWMGSDDLGAGPQLDPERVGVQAQARTDIADRHRIVIGLESHPTCREPQDLPDLPNVEWMVRQRR